MDIKDKLREGAEGDKKILYTAVVLTSESQKLLLNIFEGDIVDGWKTYAHHMTITFGKPLSVVNAEDKVGEEVSLFVDAIGVSTDAVAVRVDGFPSTNKIKHITLAVPPGGSPVNSNKIENWEPLDSTIELKGVVTEFFKN